MITTEHHSEEATTFTAPLTSLRLVREKSIRYSTTIRDAFSAYQILKPLMEDMAQETFFLLGLDTSNHITIIHQIAVGGINSVNFHVSDVLKVLLLSNSAACIVAHNHVSGAIKPSNEDLDLTKRIASLTSMMSIRFLDHIIVGSEDSYYSFADHNHIIGNRHDAPYR